MDAHIKMAIGKKVTVKVRFQSNGSVRYEFVQGILNDVVDGVLVISQRVPFSDFVMGEKSERFERKIHLSNIVDKIETFD